MKPLTIAQAEMRSSSPRAAFSAAITDRAVSRAECCASSSETSLGTLPKGPAGVPSGESGPCPETNARWSHTRTQSKGIVRPGGSFGASGRTSPSSFSRLSTDPAIQPYCLIGAPFAAVAAERERVPTGDEQEPALGARNPDSVVKVDASTEPYALSFWVTRQVQRGLRPQARNIMNGVTTVRASARWSSAARCRSASSRSPTSSRSRILGVKVVMMSSRTVRQACPIG